LLQLLDDMRSMIERLDDESYAAPARGRSSGGVGGHVRHCLDHIGALVSATKTGMCAYDRRIRGTMVETCRVMALQRIAQLEEEVGRLDRNILDVAVAVESQIDSDGTVVVTTSTIGRELVFVMSHTIHHNALVAHLLGSRGMRLGPRFGYAPATPTHDEPLSCAR
jgi:hypothetical protein